MYLKSTFTKEENTREQDDISGRRIIRADDMNYTHLILHDEDGSVYQSFDINMPYLILYKSVDVRADTYVYQEFSENSKVLTGSSYAEFIAATETEKQHFHNFYELTFVLSGELTMKIEDEFVIYHQGDCCLCNKNIHHLEFMEKNAEILLVLMKEEYIHDVFDRNYYYDRLGNPHPIRTVFDVFFSNNRKNPMYDAKVYADYRCKNAEFLESALGIVNQMITEIAGTGSGKCHMMKALLCRFFEMLEDGRIYRGEVHRAKLSNEEQVIWKITEAYRKKDGLFSRGEIEQITGYHGDYVERIVKKLTGKTLLAFGREFLVQKAAVLLKDTDLSIEEICGKMGYSNRYYFNRIFAEKYGMTPSEFRRAVNPFYSESNIRYLEQKMADYKAGRLKFAEHELIEE